MESDPASVRTIAAAAFEILKDLDEHGPNTETFYERINPQVKPSEISSSTPMETRTRFWNSAWRTRKCS
jgi:hypothetical protein